MIQLISREEIYFKSWLIDYYISEIQKAYRQRDLTGYTDQVPIPGEDPFDHITLFHDNIDALDDFAVLGYVEKSKPDYLTHRSAALISFFEQLDIKQLYLMDELKLDWLRFPFRSREKQEAMKRIVNQPAYSEAFRLGIDDLSITVVR